MPRYSKDDRIQKDFERFMEQARVRRDMIQRLRSERPDLSFEDIGAIFNISRQRAHQIYNEATAERETAK